MVLTLFECVKSEDDVDEYFQRLERLEVAPLIGTSVSMDDGESYRWRVVDMINFYPEQTSQVDGVCIAYVDRVGMPLLPPEEWYCNSHDAESLHIMLSDMREPKLELSMVSDASAPTIGKRLINYEPTGEYTMVELVEGEPKAKIGKVKSAPTDWYVDRFDTFTPQRQNPYSAVYIAWCVERVRLSKPTP